GRLAIVTDAFPRRVIAGPPPAVLAPVQSVPRIRSRASWPIQRSLPLLRSISLHVSNPGAFRTRRMPLPATKVPFEFRLCASGLCRACAPAAGLAEKLKNTADEYPQRAHILAGEEPIRSGVAGR